MDVPRGRYVNGKITADPEEECDAPGNGSTSVRLVSELTFWTTFGLPLEPPTSIPGSTLVSQLVPEPATPLDPFVHVTVPAETGGFRPPPHNENPGPLPRVSDVG